MSGHPRKDYSNYLQAGTQLNATYEVDEPLAAGGMGEVYRGHNIHTGEAVAIKVIKSDFSEHETAMALFLKEAKALSSLHHEAIVRYLGFSIDRDLRRPYLAMEFVEGESLAQIAKQSPLPVEAVLLLARRLASGFHAAHERGIVHRDVSPDNIILPHNDVRQAKIIDFGIARSTAANAQTVIGGGFAGKQNYVSPEQLGFYGEVTAKSDIYSLALVLVEALRGTPMDMGGSQVEIIEKRRTVPNLTFIDARIRPLIAKMLQPDPADRPASMLAVANWNEAAAQPEPARSSKQQAVASAAQLQAGRAAPLRQVEGKSRGGLFALLAMLVLAGGGGAYMAFGQKPVGPKPIDRPDVPVLTPSNPSAQQDKPIVITEVAVTPPADGPPLVAPDTPVAGPSVATTPPKEPPVKEPPLVVVVDPPKLPPAKEAPPAKDPPVVVADLPPKKDMAAIPGSTIYPVPPDTLRPVNTRSIEEMTRYVRDIGTGDCLASVPVNLTQTAALLDSFAGKELPFKTLNDGFLKTFGFEPDIRAWLLSENQCPFAAFMARIKIDPAAAVRIELGAARLRSGQYLTGTVETPAAKNMEVLYLSDDGMVQNITGLVRTSGPKAFNLKVDRAAVPGEKPGEKPQLVIVIVSAAPLTTLRTTKPVGADKLFPALAAEISTKGQPVGISVKSFNLD